MWLTRVSVNHPVFATMMMLAFVVLGLFSYKRLAVDQFPDIQLPVVVVSTEYPGASPEVVEVDVSRPDIQDNHDETGEKCARIQLIVQALQRAGLAIGLCVRRCRLDRIIQQAAVARRRCTAGAGVERVYCAVERRAARHRKSCAVPR